VNHPGTTLETLDVDAGLDRRAAEKIIAHRDGTDGVAPSADDDAFETLVELDALAYVGDTALLAILSHAVAHPPPSPELVEGVYFAGWQREAVIFGVNAASASELRDEVGLVSTAATNLSAAVPFANVAAMGAVSYVGPSALGKLRDHAAVWWHEMQSPASDPGMAGTYDGIAFDAETAALALEIANQATEAELADEAGVYAAGVDAIVGARPFETLGEVASTSGIGTATMQALHAYALSGAWSAPAEPLACSPDGGSTVIPVEAAYAAQMDAFDPRDPALHFRTATLDVPVCFDPSAPENAALMHALVAELAGWTSLIAQAPASFTLHPVKAGPGKYNQMLVASLDHMLMLRDWRLDQGDTGAQAEFEALQAAYLPLSTLAKSHPTTTWSTGIFHSGASCNEEAALMIDRTSGKALFMMRPGDC
jgi:DNA uptake protein ComE-like DNA-binding protein